MCGVKFEREMKNVVTSEKKTNYSSGRGHFYPSEKEQLGRN